MAGFRTSGEDGLIGDINVTPFVDIALVLLIIFMSTSAVIVKTALDLEIPVASNAKETDGNQIISVLLNDDNSLELNGESISKEEIVTFLKKEVDRNRSRTTSADTVEAKETQVLISAKGEHNYQQVIDLIDLVKGTGVNAIALNTRIENDDV